MKQNLLIYINLKNRIKKYLNDKKIFLHRLFLLDYFFNVFISNSI